MDSRKYKTLTLGPNAIDALDLDGTIDMGDWGAAFFKYKFGMPEEKFHETVKKIRKNPVYRENLLNQTGYNHGGYSPGDELAVFCVLYGIERKELIDFLSRYENGHRKGFDEYVLTPWDKVVVSSCVADLVRKRFEDVRRKTKGMSAGEIELYAAELEVDDNGRYRRIIRGCGRDMKPKVVIPYKNRGIIAAGDGDNDMKLMKIADFGVSFGNPKMGDVVIPEDSTWYYFWVFAESLRGCSPEDIAKKFFEDEKVDIDLITPRTELGENELTKLKEIKRIYC